MLWTGSKWSKIIFRLLRINEESSTVPRGLDIEESGGDAVCGVAIVFDLPKGISGRYTKLEHPGFVNEEGVGYCSCGHFFRGVVLVLLVCDFLYA